jgi:hypothetical protein
MTDRMPTALARAVHTLARSAPPVPADLELVRRRARAHRRRRAGLRTALALIVVAALGAAFALMPRTHRDQPDPAAPAPPPKRLILTASLPQSFGDADFEQPSRVFPESIVELLPDGTVKLLPKPPGLLPPFYVAPTPDGRLVVLGYASRVPETQRVVLLGRDGAVLGQHDLSARQRPSPGTLLLGASDIEVFLAGADSGALDLVTWSPGQPLPRGVEEVDAAGSRMLVSQRGVSGDCPLTVLDPLSKQQIKELRLPVSGCVRPPRMRISPDGTRVAITVTTLGPRDQSRTAPIPTARTLYILDVETGHTVASYPLESPVPDNGNDNGIVWSYETFGWADARTVVIASGRVPAGELIGLATNLDIKRFDVP